MGSQNNGIRMGSLIRFGFCVAFAWSLWANLEHSRERWNANTTKAEHPKVAHRVVAGRAPDSRRRVAFPSTGLSTSQDQPSANRSRTSPTGLRFGQGRFASSAQMNPQRTSRPYDPYPMDISPQKKWDNYIQTEKDVAHLFSRERQQELELDRQQTDYWK